MTFPINISKNHYKWGDYDGHVFEKSLNVIYDIIVYWKKNLFMLPTGGAGKDYIDEITRLFNASIQDSAMKHITFQSDNGDAFPHITETQSQLESEGSF